MGQQKNARLVFFFPDGGKHGLTDSGLVYEGWDDSVLAGGDLDKAAPWLIEDVKTHAIRHDRFYVMQANPNDSDNASKLPNMYSMIQQGVRSSLLEWETPFLKNLAS